jgi:alpha-amylase
MKTNITISMRRVWMLALLGIFAFSTSALAQPGRAVLLQGFNWNSANQNGNWYNIMRNNTTAIRNSRIDGVWFPPSSDAADRHGYLPRELYRLDHSYGTYNQLRSTISHFNSNGIRSIADIVINHRVGRFGWADFHNPAWGCWAVVRNDNWSGACGNWDTGETYHAARDIDHTNATVRNDITNWMRWMKNTVGFHGWRYDYVKGYHGSYNRIYNNNTSPWISIGELWDNLNYNNVNAHRQQIVNWIDATGGTSTAFDFTTKGVLQHAVRRNEYWRLSINGQACGVIGWWPQKAVTFVDNHDTGSSQALWPFPGDRIMEGYAYILTHPGIPMVFWDHLFDWGADIRNRINTLINIRKNWGIHSTSQLRIMRAENGLYAAIIDNNIAMKIGPNSWSPGSGWTLRTSGHNYAVWSRNGSEVEDATMFDDDSVLVAYELGLDQNYPNPANGSTTVAFTLPAKQDVIIKLYNMLGNEVATIANGNYEEGRHEVELNTQDLKPGIYTYKLSAGSKSLTKKMVVQ